MISDSLLIFLMKICIFYFFSFLHNIIWVNKPEFLNFQKDQVTHYKNENQQN